MYPINFEEDELAALFLCLKIKNNELQTVFNSVSPFEVTLNMKYMYKIHIIVLFYCCFILSIQRAFTAHHW